MTNLPDIFRWRLAIRAILLAILAPLLVCYLYSYYDCRKCGILVHCRTPSPVRHEIAVSGDFGPAIFAATALSGHPEKLSENAATFQRQQKFCYWLFLPCRYGELCYWYLVDH